jgi:alkylation response protein AidB-like acyl-CoA dehydrogenase
MSSVAIPSPAALRELRAEVREFLDGHEYVSGCDSWMRGFDPEFSRALASHGWVGMTVPEDYGGAGRSYVERFAVTEELLRAGAPVAAHWIADRQIAPTLLQHGNDLLLRESLPGICRGEVYFCVGMSEPNAGSDVAAIATRAEPVDGGWVVNGQKIWTTGAQDCHYCYLIARTSSEDDRHDGLSEFVVPMDAEGISVRPIEDLSGGSHFNEIFFDDVKVEEWRLVGERGKAFKQVVRQLDYERSGPERILSTCPLFDCLLDRNVAGDGAADGEIGRLAGRLAALRAMSLWIAQAMDDGKPPSAHAALVKDLGNTLEQEISVAAVDLLEAEPHLPQSGAGPEIERHLAEAALFAPAFTLRGGSTEILREVVVRRLHKDARRPGGGVVRAAGGEEAAFLSEVAHNLLATVGEAEDPWAPLVEAGWVGVGVEEASGGQGGGPAEAAALAEALGATGARVPLIEAVLAAQLAAAADDGELLAQIVSGELRATVVPRIVSEGRDGGGYRTPPGGWMTPWAARADVILAVARTGDGRLRLARFLPSEVTLEQGANLAGEPRDRLTPLDGAVPASAPELRIDSEQLLARTALLCSARLVGALAAARDLSLDYAGTRRQFGRPIGAFQATAHALVRQRGGVELAEATLRAALGAAGGPAGFVTAANARAVSGGVAAEVAGIAHQVHGAIGVTREYELHRFTLRLQSWRQEWGSTRWWERLVGAHAVEAGAAWWDQTAPEA